MDGWSCVVYDSSERAHGRISEMRIVIPKIFMEKVACASVAAVSWKGWDDFLRYMCVFDGRSAPTARLFLLLS